MTSTCQDPVHVFIDNSNVFIQGKHLVSSINKVSDIDYDKLLKIILGGRETAQKPIIVGSYWPRRKKSPQPDNPFWKFWKKLETNGFDIKLYENKNQKEKLVDTKITTRITASVHTEKTSTIILVAGDGDYEPPLLEAKENGWDVEVWFWRNGLAHSLKRIATKVEYLKPEHVTIDLPPSDYAQQIFSGIPPTYERNDQDLPTYEDQKASMVSGIKNPFN